MCIVARIEGRVQGRARILPVYGEKMEFQSNFNFRLVVFNF